MRCCRNQLECQFISSISPNEASTRTSQVHSQKRRTRTIRALLRKGLGLTSTDLGSSALTLGRVTRGLELGDEFIQMVYSIKMRCTAWIGLVPSRLWLLDCFGSRVGIRVQVPSSTSRCICFAGTVQSRI